MSTSSTSHKLAPKKWKRNITEMLLYEKIEKIRTIIHRVPPTLRATKPDAYDPQYVGLGPYHHWREDLYAMEQSKLIASKKSLKACQSDMEVVEMLTQKINDSIIAQIRASYDKHLEVKGPTLALMMMIDSLFLIQFLKVFENRKESYLNTQRTAHLIDPYQSAYHLILKDIMKLENQIPKFVLEKALEACEISDESLLPRMLLATCEKLSPLKLNINDPSIDITSFAHLLELLYHLIVPKNTDLNYREYNNVTGAEPLEDSVHGAEPLEDKNQERLRNCHPKISVPLFNLNMVQKLHMPVAKTNKLLEVLGNIVTVVIQSISQSSSKQGNTLTDTEKAGGSNSSEGAKAPKVEEIAIPSVSRLLSVGIEFCRIEGPITSVGFDKKSRKFYLPQITIDDNTEVIIRNLVAYEAEVISGPLVMARYTELMNGIVDTPEDVRLLREREIIVSYLRKDEDVAQLWNGMSRCIRLSHVHSIDKAIKEVNEFFDNNSRVKFYKFTKECMLWSWRIIMLLLAFVLMVLMVIQAFCDVYRCPRALAPVAAPKTMK